MPKASRYWAIVWPSGKSEVHRTWRQAEVRMEGNKCKHHAFVRQDDCEAWILRTVHKQTGRNEFYRGSLPDLIRPTFRDQLISEQFAIMQDAGLI